MKVAVVSDSHDNQANLKKMITIANQENCSFLFHLGDIIAPITARLLKEFKGKVKAVFGNCDGDKIALYRVFLEIGAEIAKPPFLFDIENKKIVLMHEPVLINELLKSHDLDFIFYGHLHKVDFRVEGKTHILNPGELAGLLDEPGFYVVDFNSMQFNRIEV